MKITEEFIIFSKRGKAVSPTVWLTKEVGRGEQNLGVLERGRIRIEAEVRKGRGRNVSWELL